MVGEGGGRIFCDAWKVYEIHTCASKVLWELGHIHSFLDCLWLFSCYRLRTQILNGPLLFFSFFLFTVQPFSRNHCIAKQFFQSNMLDLCWLGWPRPGSFQKMLFWGFLALFYTRAAPFKGFVKFVIWEYFIWRKGSMAKQINTKKFEYQDFSPPQKSLWWLYLNPGKSENTYRSQFIVYQRTFVQKTAPPDPGNWHHSAEEAHRMGMEIIMSTCLI